MHSLAPLRDQGFKIFKEVVFKPVSNFTTDAIVDLIQKQRSGDELIDEALIKSAVAIYLDLSKGRLAQDGFLPRVNLEKAILQQTQQFYEQRCKALVDQTSLIDYLKTADRHNEKEKQRVETILTWDVGQ